MNNRADSAQIISLLGALFSFIAANYDRIGAFVCALICGGYTLWKWRRAVKRAAREDATIAQRQAVADAEASETD